MSSSALWASALALGSGGFRLLFLRVLLEVLVALWEYKRSLCRGWEMECLRLGEVDRLGERYREVVRDGDSPLTPRARRRSRRGLCSAGLKMLYAR